MGSLEDSCADNNPTAADNPPVAASATPPPSGTSDTPQLWRLEFSGDHREYFRIWIVNTFLTLITCGVFAAWAKVRKKRYFCGHTKLLGLAFDYTADPVRLLLGNIVVFVLFLGYAFFGAAYPWIKFITLAIGAFVVPWLIVRALAFNARNTVHRGLSFRYRANYLNGFVTYVVMPILCIPTLGLLYPYFSYMRKKLAIEYLRFGDNVFHFEGKVKAFYGFYLIAAAPLVLWFVGLSVRIAILTGSGKKWLPDQNEILFNTIIFFAIISFVKLFVRVRKFNHVWNHTRLDGHQFRADMKFSQLLKLQLVNGAAVIGTLGLAFPWASIRLARYTLSCLSIVPSGDLSRVYKLGIGKGAALGDAATDFLGFDIGL
jgi:uncharacterized membrane protein YjgN (DUF898 family)